MPFDVIIYRLCMAAGFGFIIGYEREAHGRPAGLRTNVVVTVSACLLMILSLEISDLFSGYSAESIIRADPGRIASYAVAGMGFLGAGAIIQGQGRVRGLTSAASLWAGNAVGLATGAGFVIHAAAATVLVLLTLLPLRALVHSISKDIDIKVVLDFDACGDKIDELRMFFREYGAKVMHISFSCEFERNTSEYTVDIRIKSNGSWGDLQKGLRRLEDLKGIQWTDGVVA